MRTSGRTGGSIAESAGFETTTQTKVRDWRQYSHVSCPFGKQHGSGVHLLLAVRTRLAPVNLLHSQPPENIDSWNRT